MADQIQHPLCHNRPRCSNRPFHPTPSGLRTPSIKLDAKATTSTAYPSGTIERLDPIFPPLTKPGTPSPPTSMTMAAPMTDEEAARELGLLYPEPFGQSVDVHGAGLPERVSQYLKLTAEEMVVDLEERVGADEIDALFDDVEVLKGAEKEGNEKAENKAKKKALGKKAKGTKGLVQGVVTRAASRVARRSEGKMEEDGDVDMIDASE